VENFTDTDLLAELLALDPPPAERRPGGVTVQEYAAARKLTKSNASGKLVELYSRGN